MELTEREWQAQIVQAAHLFGWRVYHTLDSRGSAAGFPDLVLARGDVVVFAELKSERGRVSESQQDWLAALGQAQRVLAALWRPSDWPEVERVLRGVGSGR